MAGNFPADPGKENSRHDDEGRREPQPAHGQLRDDKPPPFAPPPPRGELRGTDKPPPAEQPPRPHGELRGTDKPPPAEPPPND